MGKIKKQKLAKGGRNAPLADQIDEDSFAKASRRQRVRLRQEEVEFVDDKLSQNILEQARLQQDELDEECGASSEWVPKTQLGATAKSDTDGDDEDSDVAGDEAYDYEHIEINEEDEKALELFMGKNPVARRTLQDIILERITEKQTEIATHLSDGSQMNVADLDERVVEMYRGVRQILSKYRSGKLPKAFKIIPSLANWEQILALTEPEKWSAATVYQATRIFTSNLKERMAQRFFNLVLLPRVRDDIDEYKRLNFHLFQAMRKALFKPGAFFKGFLLPLCESGDCTLREATIIGTVLARCSIPILHSSAALLKIAEMEYTGANSIFLRILLDKKYALPYRVVDAIVHHFLRFQMDKRELPVLWHQAFLTFSQRYKEDVSSDQKTALLELLRHHFHHSITPEIRRELQSAKCRDVEMSEEPMA